MTHNESAVLPKTDIIYVVKQKKQGLVLVLLLTSWADLFISFGFSFIFYTMERVVLSLFASLSCYEG